MVAPKFPGTDGPTATWLATNGTYGSLTSLVVSAGLRRGELQASTFRDNAPLPSGDLCSATVPPGSTRSTAR